MLRRVWTPFAALLGAAGVAALLFPAGALAQEEWLELLRSDIKTQKVELLTAAMKFTPQEADIFWPIYRQYEVELSKNGDARIALIKDYAANYETMTDVKAKELTEQMFKVEDERTKLRKDYFKKVEKALNATEAARFIQVERQIGLLLDTQIAAEMPLVAKRGK